MNCFTKVAAIFKDKGDKPKNEFEEWCIAALEKLDPQVDIPTFLGFLIEVESPYEVIKHFNLVHTRTCPLLFLLSQDQQFFRSFYCEFEAFSVYLYCI